MFRAGVIGSPIQHSLTPQIHRAVFDYLGLDGDSERFDVGADDTVGLMQALTRDALSVTTPLKEIVLRHCEPTERARRIGAANSLWRRDSVLQGDNVDGAGFARSLIEIDVDLRNAHVCVFGAGPAARAIVDGVIESGADRVEVIVRRDFDLPAVLRLPNVVVSRVPTWPADLVVNATTAGFSEASSGLPEVPGLEWTAYVDVVYSPAETSWMKEMRASRGADARIVNGLNMLLWQAKMQVDWWFDADVPIDIVKRAVA